MKQTIQNLKNAISTKLGFIDKTQKKKIIVACGLVLIVGAFLFFTVDTSGQNKNVEGYNLPQSEDVKKYNSKTDALTKNKVTNEQVPLEEIYRKDTISDQENIPPDLTKLDQEINNLSSSSNTSSTVPNIPMEKINTQNSSSNTSNTNSSNVPSTQRNNNKYQYTDLYEDPNTGKKPIPQQKQENVGQNREQTEVATVPKKKVRKQYWDVRLKANQKVYSGGSLSIILMQEAKNEDGDVIPKGTVMSGIVNIQNDRIYVRFTSVGINYEIFPLNFTLCDANGMEGLAIIGGDDDNTNTRSNASGVLSGALSSIPIVGGIVGGAVNDATNRPKKEKIPIKNPIKAKITTFNTTSEIY